MIRVFSWSQAIPRVFSSGLDITEMCGKSTEHYAEFWRAVQEMWIRLYGSNLVTVAAINASPSHLLPWLLCCLLCNVVCEGPAPKPVLSLLIKYSIGMRGSAALGGGNAWEWGTS